MAPKPPRGRRSGGLLGKLSERFSDAGEVGGSIDEGTRLIDRSGALLLAAVAVAEIGMERDGKGELGLAIELRGKLAGTGAEANPLVLASPDGAALLVAQIIGLIRGSRMGPEFDQCLAIRMEEAVGE